MADSFSSLLADSSRPLYIVDAQRRIVEANAALCAWLELSAEQVLGRLVEYHSEPLGGAGAPLTGLCPPPAALAGDDCVAGVSTLDRRGRLRRRRAEFRPLELQESMAYSVLVVVGDHDQSAAEQAREAAGPVGDDLHRALLELRRAQRGRLAGPLVGASIGAQLLRRQADAAAAAGCNVLIVGPRGSGRSQVARSIHARTVSGTARPLAPIACAALGSEGALAAVERAMALDPGSTLLLEEIDALSAEAHTLLARRASGKDSAVRILATCMAPPAGAFAALVSVLTITLPRLAERIEDLPQLLHWRLEQLNQGSGKQLGGVTAEARELLALYSWPGELSQLCQVLEAAHAACAGVVLEPRHLPSMLRHAATAAEVARPPEITIQLDQFLEAIERELIERALRRAEGNKAEAARLLGVTRPRLYRALERFGQAESQTELGEPSDEK